MALGSDISAKSEAFEWICGQRTAGALHPECILRRLFGQLGILFAGPFREIGDCRFPRRFGPAAAARLFSFSNATTDLRVAKNGWALASDEPALKEPYVIVSRNVHRARVRLTLEQFRRHMGSENEPRDSEGIIGSGPSDDEPPTPISEEFLLAQHSFPVLDPNGIRPQIPMSPDEIPRMSLRLRRAGA